MTDLSISLLGRLHIEHHQRPVSLCKSQKSLELLCFMILRESARKSRELIASELWPYCQTSQSRAYLRRALWQLRNWFHDSLPGKPDLIRQNGDALFVDPEANICTDTGDLYCAAKSYESVRGRDLTDNDLRQLEAVVDRYGGDLLENWYEGWLENCRDSYRTMQFALLDKIIEKCIASRRFDKGQLYCSRVLCLDVAREKTHRAKMQLFFDAGNRIDALRQYDNCCRMLSREFDIGPSIETQKLREKIAGHPNHGNFRILPRSGT